MFAHRCARDALFLLGWLIVSIIYHTYSWLSCFFSILFSDVLSLPAKIITPLFLVFIITGCQSKEKESEEVIRPVKLFTVQDSTREQVRRFPGIVTASNEALISFRIPGQLIDLPLYESQHVEQGDLLAQIDDQDIKNELKDRQANYDLARIDYERNKSLLKRKVTSQSAFDKSTAQLKSTKAALDISAARVNYTKINAPFSGRVARLEVEAFQFVEAKQTILLLQSDNTVDVHIQVPENIIVRVDASEIDMTYQPYALFTAAPERKFPLVYKEHSTKVTPGTQTYEVVMTMTLPQDLTILPGMTVIVVADLSKIFRQTSSVDYVLVPITSIMKDDTSGQVSAWRFNEETKTVKAVSVELGRITEIGVEILNGLEPGDIIVSAGISYLSNGMKVKPLYWERGL